MKIRDFILIFLSSRSSRCATLDEILKALLSRGFMANSKNPKAYTLKIISMMVRQRVVRRAWIQVPTRPGKWVKKRYYCVRGD